MQRGEHGRAFQRVFVRSNTVSVHFERVGSAGSDDNRPFSRSHAQLHAQRRQSGRCALCGRQRGVGAERRGVGAAGRDEKRTVSGPTTVVVEVDTLSRVVSVVRYSEAQIVTEKTALFLVVLGCFWLIKNLIILTFFKLFFVDLFGFLQNNH